jgi:hypothetical protein
MIIDILRVRTGSIGRRTAPVLQQPVAVKLRCFAVAGQAQGGQRGTAAQRLAETFGA